MRFRRTPLLALLAAAFAASLTVLPARAIIINGEGPDGVTGIYDRFIVGSYPGGPVPNPTFIGAGIDLSGIGWLSTNATRSLTLISPRYFIAATHYLPGIGSTIRFFGTDAVLYSSTVHSYFTLTYDGTGGPQSSDLTIGRLSTSLPAQVTPMPIAYLGATDISNPSTFDLYGGLPLLNYGRTARMGTNVLDLIGEYSFGMGPPTNIGLAFDHDAGAGETLLESGDSGSPTLADLGDGVFGLIGVHSGVDPPTSVDAFVSYTPFIDQINAILANDSQSLTLVPEPGAMAFGLAVFGICGARRRRETRRAV